MQMRIGDKVIDERREALEESERILYNLETLCAQR